MKRIMISLVVLASLVSSYAYAEVYSYIGPKYEDVNGQYTTDMRITGKLVTSSPIPPNVGGYDISGILTGWSFFDGVQTINSTNGTVHPSSPPWVNTDASGNITSGFFYILRTPIATVVGGLLDLIYIVPSWNYSAVGALCITVPDGICRGWDGNQTDSSAQVVQNGVWVTSDLPSTPIPTLSQWTLMLLALMLGLVGIARVRKHV